ncbi:acetyltransferase [Marinospirillum insulare]|uniref:Sialic acid synthase n=1 Tax=Marinospirillum insulare TaxID=217169 RepID=A0ABQ5ZWM7_9GAMM|nr:acetyltransferase [Marinospirillum insulare]GLR63046.1 sialic acid synthase [Marinospirillum insulare]
MAKPLVMLGAGGHASVLAEILFATKQPLLAVVTPDIIQPTSLLAGLQQITEDKLLLNSFGPEEVDLVNGLGSVPGNDLRYNLFNYFTEQGYSFASVISPHALVSSYAKLDEGVQIMAGAIIQTNATIGKNTLINTGAIVEHDCIIGVHNHLAPGTTLSGNVTTAKQVHIGTGANVIQGIQIGEQAVIGAGVSIAKNVPAQQVIIPAANRIATQEKIVND